MRAGDQPRAGTPVYSLNSTCCIHERTRYSSAARHHDSREIGSSKSASGWASSLVTLPRSVLKNLQSRDRARDEEIKKHVHVSRSYLSETQRTAIRDIRATRTIKQRQTSGDADNATPRSFVFCGGGGGGGGGGILPLDAFLSQSVSHDVHYAAPRTHCVYFMRICTIPGDSERATRTGQLFMRPIREGDPRGMRSVYANTARLPFYRSEDIGFINIIG